VPGWRAQRAQRWLSIVGHRERISELAGPPQRIASHPAAAQRLQVAQLLLTQAAATHAAAQQDTGSPSKQQQEKGVPPEVSEPWMLKPSSDSPAAKTTVAATAAATAADAALLHKLTGLMQRQPYPPLSTRPADLESTLMSFVQRGPGGRLVVDGKPWCVMAAGS
jgi:alkylation response protein AidB-like acyl-CoA dehydrogenase